MTKKTIVTLLGIRPDIIRMSEIIKKLDKEFNHILVWSGQHYDEMLSNIFFEDLNLRKPDYDLKIGGPTKEHFHQTSELIVKFINLLKVKNINPDLILLLGDSNTVITAPIFKKEGYKIGHIEAGMRSGDKKMFEEINRIVCDCCSDIHFVYHKNYKNKLIKENLPKENIYVVGNTIVEVCNKYCGNMLKKNKTNDFILMDIHRPENFKYENRLRNIIIFGEYCSRYFKVPVKMLKFSRTMKYIKKYNINTNLIKFIDLMPYKRFLQKQYDSKFLISDSGSAQEESSLLYTSVIVPRDYTERPESVKYGCSFMLNVNKLSYNVFKKAIKWVESKPKINSSWLGKGDTSFKVVEKIKDFLC